MDEKDIKRLKTYLAFLEEASEEEGDGSGSIAESASGHIAQEAYDDAIEELLKLFPELKK